MPDIDRRSFVAGAWGVLGLMQNVSAATPSGGDPGRPPAGAAAARHASDTLPAVTRTLATYVVHARVDDLPVAVRSEACRTLLNWAGCVVATADPSIGEAQARASITLKNGSRVEKFVEHAVGSLERPLSDRDLDAKVRDLCDGVLIADAGRAS